MATDFGFRPNASGRYFFISYNTDDMERVKPIAYDLYRKGFPVWYDVALEYGEEWERQIAAYIRGAEAVILFVTSGIFFKERSYVRKEFDIARMYKTRIIPVFLDEIIQYDVPTQYAGWWVDLTALQGINGRAFDTEGLAQQIMTAVGYKKEESAEASVPEKEDTDRAVVGEEEEITIEIGGSMTFGNYPQYSDVPEPITWRVLDKTDGRVLMISDKLLDTHRFDPIGNDWKRSELRAWLNGEFLNKAFSAEEQKRLICMNDDKVTCLSIEEAKKYFNHYTQKKNGYTIWPDKMADPTEYTREKRAYIKSDFGTGWWWLRSPGCDSNHAAGINTFGDFSMSGYGVYYDNYCVRPVVLIVI